jgi:PTS system mannose-specific IIA component
MLSSAETCKTKPESPASTLNEAVQKNPKDNTVVVVAHAPLATALVACALHVMPDCANHLVAIDVYPNASREDSLKQAQSCCLGHSLGTPFLVLTDIKGSTPFYVACRLAASSGHSPNPVVCGVNLPMLLRALCYQKESVATMAEFALEGGLRGILRVEDLPSLPL